MFSIKFRGRGVLPAALAIFGTVALHAQSLHAYLALRKHYGAGHRVELDSVVGTRVIELEAVAKGSILVKGKHFLVLDQDGKEFFVEAESIPEWLDRNEVRARMLVRATRSEGDGEITSTLLAVVPASQLASSESADPRKRRSISTKPISKVPSTGVTPIYAAFIRKQNPRLSQAESTRIAKAIVGFSIAYNVDARLIVAVVITESGFNPASRSRSGAMGLGQLMPSTAKWMGVNNAYDSTENISGAVRLIRTHMNAYRGQKGDTLASIELALAAYNAGAGAVSRAGGIPPYRETQNYVKKVVAIYYALCGKRA